MVQLQSHTYFIPMILERGDENLLIPGSQSASHSRVTGGSQTGRLVEPGFLSCCQGAATPCWLTAQLRHHVEVSLSFNSPSHESFRDLLLL